MSNSDDVPIKNCTPLEKLKQNNLIKRSKKFFAYEQTSPRLSGLNFTKKKIANIAATQTISIFYKIPIFEANKIYNSNVNMDFVNYPVPLLT